MGGGRIKKCFPEVSLSDNKLDILDNFPSDGNEFPTASKKVNQKAQGKKVSDGGPYVPPPPVI